jgi:hypothetical protein
MRSLCNFSCAGPLDWLWLTNISCAIILAIMLSLSYHTNNSLWGIMKGQAAVHCSCSCRTDEVHRAVEQAFTIVIPQVLQHITLNVRHIRLCFWHRLLGWVHNQLMNKETMKIPACVWILCVYFAFRCIWCGNIFSHVYSYKSSNIHKSIKIVICCL